MMVDVEQKVALRQCRGMIVTMGCNRADDVVRIGRWLVNDAGGRPAAASRASVGSTLE